MGVYLLYNGYPFLWLFINQAGIRPYVASVTLLKFIAEATPICTTVQFNPLLILLRYAEKDRIMLYYFSARSKTEFCKKIYKERRNFSMKLKKVLSLILCVAMVLSTMSFAVSADEATVSVVPVEVTTYEGLIEALAKENANVIIMNDITATATQSNGYGKAGIVVDAGDILDGNGKTLTINGANGTWDSVIGMKGGTVKNLTVSGAMRGIFMPGANGDVVIDNCVFKDVIYTFNSDAGSKDYTVTIKNSVLNGWTSFSNVHKSVAFENCTFGEGSGYQFCRPYNETTFTGCEFNEGFEIDMRATQTFNECTYDGDALGINNINKLFINDGKNVIIDNKEVTLNQKAVAYIGLTAYTDLHEVLKNAGAAGAGNTTIEIVADVDLENVAWTPVNVDGYHGADIVTINGNGHTITNLSAPLFAGGFAGGSGIVINDLTIEDSTIVSANTIGSGAFIESVDSMAKIELKNCNLLNSSVTGSRTGGLLGWTAGYNNTNDGPVKTYITISDCSVIGCTITGSSVGAINGHAGNNAWTYTTIENCEIKDNKLISTDDGGWRVGVVVGTANVGQVAINKIEESNNTLSQGDVTAKDGQTNLVGRFVPSSKEEDKSNLVIDNIAYTTECKPYAVTVSDDNGVSGYNTFDEAAKNIGAGEVSIEISQDASLNVSDAYIKLGTADTESITINGNKNRLDLTTTYWSRLNLANPDAKLILNDMTVDSSQESGTWNSYDVTFMCPVELNNVVFEKAVALENDATLKNVQISETHDYYALWISANGQEVSIDSLTITSEGRGIKIDDQYVSNVGKVTLDVKNATFETVKKAAIMVDSSAGAAITAADCDISKVAADSENLVWIDEGSAADQKEVTVNGKPAFVENQCVRLNEDMHFASIKDAIDNAQPGDTITLLGNITEKVVIKAPAAATLAANEAIVVDLAGHTLNGYIIIEDSDKAIKIKNGNIVNEDLDDSAIESNANITLTNVNIKSARHAVNIEGSEGKKPTVTVNGGSYTLITSAGKTQNAFAAENAIVTINGGVFVGPAGTASDSGAALSAKKGSNITVVDGYFSGGKNNTIAKNETATLALCGGSYDQDVSAYVGEGYEVVNRGSFDYPYTVEEKAAQSIKVSLEKVPDNDKLYNIVLHANAPEGETVYDINEFVAAEFVFNNESTTLSGAKMKYTVSGNSAIGTVAQKAFVDNKEQYIINLKADAIRPTGKEITIGQIEFIGQGTTKFNIVSGEVDATKKNTNLGRYYSSTDATLDLLDVSAAVINGSVTEVTRDVAIKVAYNHPLANVWSNPEMTVTLVDYFGNKYEDSIADGLATFNGVSLGRITVTLEAPGFRKFVYNTTLDEDDDATVVLHFWNDVKVSSDLEKIEKDGEKYAHNFVVGDIVMDYIVDKYDLAAVTSYYGMYDIENNAKYLMYDLNRDGNIDIRDVQYVLHTMGN